MAQLKNYFQTKSIYLIMENKNHILYSADRNYIGHWDLPMDGKDLILTIEKIEEHDIENPKNGEIAKGKRVVFFKEKQYKPLLCNKTNAKRIYLACGRIKEIGDYKGKGKKVSLYIDQTYSAQDKCKVDCIRIRPVPPKITLPNLKDSDIENTVAWMKQNPNNTMKVLRKVKIVSKAQETKINNLLNPPK